METEAHTEKQKRRAPRSQSIIRFLGVLGFVFIAIYAVSVIKQKPFSLFKNIDVGTKAVAASARVVTNEDDIVKELMQDGLTFELPSGWKATSFVENEIGTRITTFVIDFPASIDTAIPMTTQMPVTGYIVISVSSAGLDGYSKIAGIPDPNCQTDPCPTVAPRRMMLSGYSASMYFLDSNPCPKVVTLFRRAGKRYEIQFAPSACTGKTYDTYIKSYEAFLNGIKLPYLTIPTLLPTKVIVPTVTSTPTPAVTVSVTKAVTPTVSKEQTCPKQEWIDCMPGPNASKPECASSYIIWARQHCPNFKGVAY